MAFASSIPKGQIPVGCQLCEGGNKIQWKCITCESLMCDKCKDGVHLKIGKDHQIININEIGKQEDTIIFSEVKCGEHSNQACCLFCKTCNRLICFKCITKVHNGHELIEEEDYNKGKVQLKPKQESEIKLEISKVYTTDLTYIHYIAVCSDGSMWMGDNVRSLKLQHVKLRENRTEIITSLNTKIWGMAKTYLNNILIIPEKGTKLKLINTVTGEITDSRYDVKPLLPTNIHVTSDHRVIMGAKSRGKKLPVTGRRVVVVMDQKGKQLKEYEHDNHNKPLFTYPVNVTCTSNGNICVVDILDDDCRGRVVVLSPGGDILGTYTGHPDVNTEEKPFKPHGILITPLDNIVVTDMNNHLLHILSDQGQSITYYNLCDIGMLVPHSLALSTTGTIYIGCINDEESPDSTKAKLYELNFSGF